MGAGKAHNGLHVRRAQAANGALRAAHADLHLGGALNAHVQVFGSVMEFQRRGNDGLHRGIMADSPPQQKGQAERHDPEPEIVENVFPEEVTHG